MRNWFVILLSLITASALAGDPVITCEPRELRGVPGQPLQAELTVESDRANPIQLRIPAVRNLFLRTVEKIPIRCTKEGRFIQKRIIIWQGTEPGSVTLTNLTIVTAGGGTGFPGLKKKCPDIGITIDAVESAKPPNNPPRPAATPPMEGNKKSSMHSPLPRRGAGTAGWILHIQLSMGDGIQRSAI